MDLLNKDIQLFGGGFDDKKKESFYSELNILLTSGIDIKTVFELIEGEQKKEKEKEMFRRVKEDIVRGHSLSEALRATGKFSEYEYHSIKIGEETGRLPEVLTEMTEYYTRRIKQKRQVVGTLSYPLIVMSFAFLIMFLMLKYFVPMFKDIFQRFDAELPVLTQYIVRLSEVMNQYFIYAFAGIVVVVLFLFRSRKTAWYRKYSTILAFRAPLFGKFIQKVYLARFCQSMGLLIGAKTNLVDALGLVKNMISFYPIESTIDPMIEAIMKGKSLHESMAQYPVYNHRLVSLIKVAEEVNQLDKMFNRLSKQYSEELDHESKVIANLLEPFIIVFLGIMVCTILLSMYLPLFQLSTVIK